MSEKLTNEQLKDVCASSFDLAHYAIRLWRYFIRSGRETTLQDILKEVRRHPNPNYVQELQEVDEITSHREKEPRDYVG